MLLDHDYTNITQINKWNNLNYGFIKAASRNNNETHEYYINFKATYKALQ